MRRARRPQAFSALAVRNFRVFITGQFVSQCGTFMQTVAVPVLVLQLGGSGTQVGLAFALQYTPMLVLAPVGGLIADRFDNRHALLCTQSASAVQALALAVLTATGAVELWMVYVLAAGLGITNAFDSPIRQTFVFDMVGTDQVRQAVSVNSMATNMARIIGPALSGVLIAVFGITFCFFANAGSFVAVIIGLLLIRSSELTRRPNLARADTGGVRAGLRYVGATRELLVPLVILAAIGTLVWEFPVTLPLLTKFTFHEGVWMFSLMMVLISAGGLIGAYLVGGHVGPGGKSLSIGCFVLAAGMLAAAIAPSVPLAVAVMVPIGAAAIATLATGQTGLQLDTDPAMRGRVMGLFAIAVAGSSAIGGPIVGWICDVAGPRYGILVGSIASAAAGVLGYFTLVRHRRGRHAFPVPIAGVDAAEVADAADVAGSARAAGAAHGTLPR
jgi:MFS family permease